MSVNQAVIGVGSNIDPEYNIKKAGESLADNHRLIKSSTFIETEPIGYKNQSNFLNGAFLIETEMGLPKLKSWLKKLEDDLGRVKTENKNGPRTIDLDIVLWNGEVIDNEIYERDFLFNSVKELLPDIAIKSRDEY